MATVNKYNTLPEQVQENKDDIQVLDEGLEALGETINKNYDDIVDIINKDINDLDNQLSSQITNLESKINTNAEEIDKIKNATDIITTDCNISDETSSSLRLKLNNLSSGEKLTKKTGKLYTINDATFVNLKTTDGTFIGNIQISHYQDLYAKGSFIDTNSGRYYDVWFDTDANDVTIIYIY